MSTRRLELPDDLLSELNEWGEKANMGYATAAEAVKDAIRARIDQLRMLAMNQHYKKEKGTAPIDADTEAIANA